MSRIGKGIKKVFRGAKKVLKKVAKPALIVGGAFFASGLALGGFKGFSSLLEGNNIFEAVGKTLGAGAQAIGGAFGIGEGVSPELLSEMGVAEGTTLGSRIFGDALGLSTPSTAKEGIGGGTLPEYLQNKAGETAEEAATGGFISNILGGFNNLSDPVQAALLRGVGTGFQAYMVSEEAKKERRRQRKRGIFGVPMGAEFGSGVSPEEMASAVRAGVAAGNQPQGQVPPLYSGLMAQPAPSQPTNQQAYPNPYTTPPPPQSSGPLLG